MKLMVFIDRMFSVLIIIILFQKWAVVLFTEDSSISTVPSKWLLGLIGENGELECFWPNKKIRQHIQNASDADEEWSKFKVKILHETDDYNGAKNFEKNCSGGESSDSTNDCVMRPGSRKRKSMKNKDFTSGDSSDEDFDLPALPKVPKKMDKRLDTSETNKIHQDSPSDFPSNKEVSESGSDTSTASTLSFEEESPSTDPMIMPPPSTTKVVKKQTHSSDKGSDECCCVHINRLNEHVVIIRTILEELKNSLAKIILPQAAGPQSIIDSFDTIPQSALNKHKHLIRYENTLKSSDTARKQLETLFFIGGGNCSNDFIKRGLIRIFSNKLAKKFSWYGRKNNYPLNNLIIISTLRDAARKRFPGMTDSEFEKHTATWFRQANLRFRREGENIPPGLITHSL